MRKLSGPRALLLLILVALVAGTIYFGLGYYWDRGDKDALADDIAAVEEQIRVIEQLYNIDELKADLENLQQQKAEVPFPQDVERNIVHDYVMTAADKAGVAFENWDAPAAAVVATVNGTDQEYRLFVYDAAISGTLDEIFDFLAEMEANAPYDTMKIDEVELTYDSATLSWSMTFTILVYAQPE